MTNTMTPEIALSNWLECGESEIENAGYEYYGLPVFELNGREYAVVNDADAQVAAKNYIKDSIWAFNAEFILSKCGLPLELAEAIKAFQVNKGQSANDALLALVEKTCGLETFVTEAICADGRGHFLSPYDGRENEQDGFYIYRVN